MTVRPARREPVVVGVDDTGSADDALEWAAAEAAARGCRLRIVHAFQPPAPADPYGLIPLVDYLCVARTAAEALLGDCVGRARSVASDVHVSAELLEGPAAPALLAEADHAKLLVLGNRGRHGLWALLAGSVSAQVAAQAPCPVVVVRPRHGEDASAWSTPRVVVGVDDHASCELAVGFALEAGRQRGLPVEAVHVWTPDPPADLEGIHGSPAVGEQLGRRTLERALRPWRPRFPDVPIATTLLGGEPARALVAASRGAALLVIGSSGRGSVRATLLGSVSRSVLQRAHSPVAVVRRAGGAAPGNTPGAIADCDHGPGEGGTPGRRRRSRSRRRSA
jgi:nucleotide-binding universal stress UspA family protein